jgi:hypothetical protein
MHRNNTQQSMNGTMLNNWGKDIIKIKTWNLAIAFSNLPCFIPFFLSLENPFATNGLFTLGQLH